MPPRRILLVEANEDGTVGGSHRSMFNLASRVDRSRFEPVVCFYQDNAFVSRFRDSGVEVHTLDGFRARERRIRSKRNLAMRIFGLSSSIVERLRIIKQWRVDLIHINNSPHVGFWEWLPAARISRTPIVSSARGDADPIPGPVRQWLVKSFDHYIPVSHYMTDALVAQGVDPCRITTVQNGVDLADLRARIDPGDRDRIRNELDVPPEALLGVMVGNIRDWKGQHVVLDALGLLRKGERPWVVAFAGSEDPADPRYGASLQERAKNLGIESRVRWVGRRSDVPNLFHAADAGLHASVIPEPFGLVMVECMAVGTPMIAAREGGASEIVTESTGWTYPGGDAEALASILREVGRLSPDELAARHSEASIRADAFGANRMAREVQDVWARFVSPRASGE